MTEFRRLLRELVQAYGGAKQDLARAIGVTPSTLSHLLARDGAPSVYVCLKLAQATGTSASKVLRAAKKEDIAELIEDLFGEAATRRQVFQRVRLTPLEERYVTALRALPPKTQRAFFTLISTARGWAGREPDSITSVR